MLVVTALEHAGGAVPLADLARRTGLPKTSTYRLAEELTRHALVERTPDGYRSGPRLYRSGGGPPPAHALPGLALPHLTDLCAATGCLARMAVLDGVDVVDVQVVHPPVPGPPPTIHPAGRPPGPPARPADRWPAHASAAGKAILAYSPASRLAARVEAGLVRRTPRTICTLGALEVELATVRENGVAFDREECLPGLHRVAAPVFAADGEVVAAIAITGRSTREVVQMAPAVRVVALSLDRLLHAGAPAPD